MKTRAEVAQIGLDSHRKFSKVTARDAEGHIVWRQRLEHADREALRERLRQWPTGVPVVLVNLVGRVQGLMTPPGNPQGIHSLEDLRRPEVSFVNRQRGSGTRVLLDYKLKEMGATPEQIRGYQRDEYSHLAVAAAVRGGSASTGLGILSAARALGLDFVPLLNEQYDLVIPRVHYESELLQPLLALLRDPDFHREVNDLGGYDTNHLGQVAAELG